MNELLYCLIAFQSFTCMRNMFKLYIIQRELCLGLTSMNFNGLEKMSMTMEGLHYVNNSKKHIASWPAQIKFSALTKGLCYLSWCKCVLLCLQFVEKHRCVCRLLKQWQDQIL